MDSAQASQPKAKPLQPAKTQGWTPESWRGCGGGDIHLRQYGVLRLRGGVLEVQWRPAALKQTKEWLQATTLDGSPVESRFTSPWGGEDCPQETLIHMAAEMGDAAAIARLVEGGVDVNTPNDFGQTPLHKAAMMAHESLWTLSTLLRYGADVLRQDKGGSTAADEARLAIERGEGPPEALDLLERAEAIARAARGLESGNETRLDDKPLAVPSDDPGLEALRITTDAKLPPSLDEYLEVQARATMAKKIEEREREEEEKQRQKDEEKAGLDSNKKRKVPNKKKYKNVKERWAKYKEKKKEKNKAASG